MAYNNGREDRKWRIWKEAEEKVLREHGVDETTIEQIRIDDRADFNSNRRFYHWTSDFGEYLEGMADNCFSRKSISFQSTLCKKKIALFFNKIMGYIAQWLDPKCWKYI